VKFVIDEAESPALVEAVREPALYASDLVRAELRRAVARRRPDRLKAADKLLARLRLVPLTPELLDAAGRLAPAGLRSLDAIHVQSALLLGDELDALITYDDRMAEAAGAAGLTVRAPG